MLVTHSLDDEAAFGICGGRFPPVICWLGIIKDVRNRIEAFSLSSGRSLGVDVNDNIL